MIFSKKNVSFFFNMPCSRNHTEVTENIEVFRGNIVSQECFFFISDISGL